MHKRISTRNWIAATLLLLAAASAQALPTVVIGTLPANPAPGSDVQIVVSGQWPDGCTPEKFATITSKRTGNEFLVTFTFTPFGGGPCATVVTPYKVTVAAGTLAYGTYEVKVQQERPLQSPQLLGSGSFEVKDPLVTYYVPGVLAGGDVTLSTTVSAYNNGNHAATARFVAAYDTEGMHDLSASDPIALAPADAAVLDTRPSRPGQAVQFLALAASPGVALHPALERIASGDSLGRLTLPLFLEPFAAGTRTVAGDVTLSSAECAAPDKPRRLNVTLWNAGASAATFTVNIVTRGSTPGPGGAKPADLELVVPARSVKQVNGLGFDVVALCGGATAWIEITADQPYLAYASTVRQDGPGVLPYEVFPARVDR